jgi:hypothetical protein
LCPARLLFPFVREVARELIEVQKTEVIIAHGAKISNHRTHNIPYAHVGYDAVV